MKYLPLYYKWMRVGLPHAGLCSCFGCRIGGRLDIALSLQAEVDRLTKEKTELLKGLKSIEDAVQFQSSGYARSVSIIASNLLTRIK